MNEPDSSREIPEFPQESWVEVRYPLTSEQEHGDRSAWPWLPGWVDSQCGPDEWQICVQVPELATLEDGSPAPDGTPEDEAFFPLCFRESSEIRMPSAEPEATS